MTFATLLGVFSLVLHLASLSIGRVSWFHRLVGRPVNWFLLWKRGLLVYLKQVAKLRQHYSIWISSWRQIESCWSFIGAVGSQIRLRAWEFNEFYMSIKKLKLGEMHARRTPSIVIGPALWVSAICSTNIVNSVTSTSTHMNGWPRKVLNEAPKKYSSWTV